MHDAFVPLEVFLRPSVTVAEVPAEPIEDRPPDRSYDDSFPLDDDAWDDALSAMRRFRAALADALDASLDILLREIATTVVARELRLTPADVRAIAARELALVADDAVRCFAHPQECAALQEAGYVVAADPQLRRGDLRLEVKCGTIDATLGARLERALACAATP